MPVIGRANPSGEDSAATFRRAAVFGSLPGVEISESSEAADARFALETSTQAPGRLLPLIQDAELEGRVFPATAASH